MPGNYNFTRAGLRNAEEHGITPAEVWEVVGAEGVLYTPVGENRTVVFGATAAGRYLAVLVEEDQYEDDTWDIVASRDMADEEISALRRLMGGGDE